MNLKMSEDDLFWS